MFDPSLMIAPNVGGMIQQGIEQGQQERQQNLAKGALAALVRDPTNQRALAALAQVDPERAMEFRKQQLEFHKSQLSEHADSILKGAELFRAAKLANPNVPDEQIYPIAYQAAQQAGLTLTDVPPPGDPRVPGYIKGLMTIADGLKPQTDSENNPHYITPQPGGGAYKYDPVSGKTVTIIAPNDGTQQPGAAVGASGPPPQAIQLLKSNPGLAAHFDEKYGAGASAQVLGGQTAQPSGGFPGY